MVAGFAAAALVAVAAVGDEQQNESKRDAPTEPKKTPAWDSSWKLSSELRFDDNVFLLDPDDKQRLVDEQGTSRFDGMKSNEDVILAPVVRFEAKGPSPLGRKLALWAELEYERYFRNPARSNFAIGIGANQSVGSSGQLGLGFTLEPDHFKKNYLAGAADANSDGSIDPSERLYAAGTYREGKLELEYEHTLVAGTSARPFRVDGSFALGLRERTFPAPLQNRDEDGLYLALGLDFKHGPGWKWRVSYRYENIDAPGDAELLILDEPDFGVDFNADSDSADRNVPTVQFVDRTRRDRKFGLSLDLPLGDTTELRLSVGRLRKEFLSTAPFDVAHRGRNDTRDTFGIALGFRVAKGWDGTLGYEATRQETGRPADPGAAGEVLDYRRNVLFFSTAVRW